MDKVKEEIEKMAQSFYEVMVHCFNCDFHGKIKVKKGIRVHTQSCPNCECITLFKTTVSVEEWSNS